MLAVRPSTVPSLQPAVASASRAPSAKNAEVNLLSPFQRYQPWNNPPVARFGGFAYLISADARGTENCEVLLTRAERVLTVNNYPVGLQRCGRLNTPQRLKSKTKSCATHQRMGAVRHMASLDCRMRLASLMSVTVCIARVGRGRARLTRRLSVRLP